MTQTEVMEQAELRREVVELIDDRVSSTGVAAKSWIVKEMVDRHDDLRGRDRAMAKLCMYGHIATTVRLVLQDQHRKEEAVEGERQLLLPGHKRLQLRYSVDRDGEQMIVSLEEMTVSEGRAKSKELRAMAKGNLAHADELDDYFDRRAAA
ncbi:MAG TPA: hypothetical protein VF962_04160 [Gemmatimonadaceae bacterium]